MNPFAAAPDVYVAGAFLLANTSRAFRRSVALWSWPINAAFDALTRPIVDRLERDVREAVEVLSP